MSTSSLTWQVATAGATGAQHEAAGLPYQDAAATVGLAADGAPGPVAVAVADGHGHTRHFRSDRGARFAAGAACQVGAQLVPQLEAAADAADVESIVDDAIVGPVLTRWRRAVAADLVAEPMEADDPVLAYGSTLAVAVLTGRWAVAAQIGDGDMIGIGPSGDAVPLVAPAPVLDGNRTASLCQDDAEEAFRVAVLDVRVTPVVAVLLATDGYGNAQVDDPWEPGVAADLARLLQERGGAWVATQLPSWAARCASSEGSGDDVTLALAFDASCGDARADRQP